uniref:GPI-anchored protein LLG1-like domain-containing protein n=1 Tax=Oryza punctata TaxID=4537 RepID=A0A0E0KSE2_ORYPU
MGSSTILFYCVALSVVAAAVVSSAAEEAEAPQDEASFLSAATLASSDSEAKTTETSRRALTGHEEIIAKPCPMQFEEVKGYEELGAKCKEKHTMKECCELFKKLACPYNHLFNDITNVCANDLFYFIHTKGKLQPGTILENCNEGPTGIKC